MGFVLVLERGLDAGELAALPALPAAFVEDEDEREEDDIEHREGEHESEEEAELEIKAPAPLQLEYILLVVAVTLRTYIFVSVIEQRDQDIQQQHEGQHNEQHHQNLRKYVIIELVELDFPQRSREEEQQTVPHSSAATRHIPSGESASGLPCVGETNYKSEGEQDEEEDIEPGEERGH